jgi:hypothetical protein
MKKNNYRSILLATLMMSFAHLASAGHVDQLGMNMSLFSHDGQGNFVIQYDQYMAADGSMWNANTNSWYATYAQPRYLDKSIHLSVNQGTTATGRRALDADFMGLVDSTGAHTAGFGSGQINTQFINDLTDAALYTEYKTFSIQNYDASLTYLVSADISICCIQQAGGGNNSASFAGTFQINPTTVPIPAAAWLFASGLILVARTKKTDTLTLLPATKA